MKKLLTATLIASGFLFATPAYAVTTSASNTTSLSTGLVGYWTFDGGQTSWSTNTTRDSSGRGDTGTLTLFSTTTSPVTGKVGQALKFNGTTQYVQIPTASPLDITGPVTMAAWIKPITLGDGTYRTILGKRTTGSGTNYEMFLHFSTGAFSFYNGTQHNSTYIPTANKWTYVAVVVTSNTVTFYANGAQVYTMALTGSIAPVVGSLAIGRAGDFAGAEYFNGSIDDVRLYSRALSAPEIAQLYRQSGGTATVAVANATTLNSGLIGYWTFDGKNTNWATGRTLDLSGLGRTGILQALATTTASIVGKVGQALAFNGTTSYVAVGSDLGFRGDVAVSASAWFKPTGTNSNNFPAIVDFQSQSGSCTGLYFTVHANRPSIDFAVNRWRATAALTQGKWYHVVVTKSPGLISTTSHIYVNGVEVAGAVENGDCTPNVSAPGAGGLVLGRLTHTSNYVSGGIDDVRIWNRALSAAEVALLYKTGNTGAAQSNMALANSDSSLVGYWTLDGVQTNWNTNTTKDSSGNGNTGTFVSMSTTTSPVTGKVGQGIKLNGSTQSIALGQTGLTPTTITAASWVKLAATQNTRVFVANFGQPSGTSGWGTGISDTTNNVVKWFTSTAAGTNDTLYSTFPLVNNQWYFVVGTYDGAVKKLYINGVLNSSVAWANGIGYSSPTASIGNLRYFSSQYLNGTIDDVRVYNRALTAAEILQLYNATK